MDAMLLTGSLLAALVCAWCAYDARSSARLAESEAHTLRASKGRIVGLEHGLENLHHQHRKLAGRVYANERFDVVDDNQEGSELVPIPELDGRVLCDNWKLAQVEGPQSRAAKCECQYCVAARAARSAARAALVPRAIVGGKKPS